VSRALGWYVYRLQRMSVREVATRAADELRRAAWAPRQVEVGRASGVPKGLVHDRRLGTPLPDGTRTQVPDDARRRVVAAADRLLTGQWSVLGTPRPDIVAPDWFLDPVTGRHAPSQRLAFRIDHRDEAETGNIKSVWELSRHHHLTVLAAAWWLTHDDAYADVLADQLRCWWRENPFLSGVHWTSGIELGVRLISWVWVRRLLDEWPKVGDLFDTNEEALRQIWWHQSYLASFRSRGSSANNHVVAEAAGQLVAACALPWFAESDRWRRGAASLLEAELAANTFGSGVNRELATDYHRFVTELGVVAAVEADAAGHPLGSGTWARLTSSFDAAAGMVDATGRPPRQGDGDEGRGLQLDAPDLEPWGLLTGVGAAVVGPLSWWPTAPGSVEATVLAALASTHAVRGRTSRQPSAFADAGMYLLRTPAGDGPEIWCRCDGGPDGYLSIAAHAHADALSVEVRYAGVEVFADPGTYCYHGDPQWRSYFRSTLAHNTVEVDGVSQLVEGGPFLWRTRSGSRVDRADVDDRGVQVWAGHHSGYDRLGGTVRHSRTVSLDPTSRHLLLVDVVTTTSEHRMRLAFHVGPEVSARLSGALAQLTWPTESGPVTANLLLPWQLHWTEHRGETDPVLGWYSPRFGERVPTTTLVGTGSCDRLVELRTLLVFPSA
jgi:Heparinase II/III-like protein/Heparinase II/III N-terminus